MQACIDSAVGATFSYPDDIAYRSSQGIVTHDLPATRIILSIVYITK